VSGGTERAQNVFRRPHPPRPQWNNGNRGRAANSPRRLALVAAGALIGFSAGDSGTRVRETTATEPTVSHGRSGGQLVSKPMRVNIGSKTFVAVLEDTPAATGLRAMLPLTLDMSELNGNEKYAALPARLPTDVVNPGTIRTGDLLLWQSDTLVLFYETFRTAYGYTRFGRIDNPEGLAAAVGSGGVTVTFGLE
jgi:hypothetical protein